MKFLLLQRCERALVLFYSQFSEDVICGNIIIGISDHMPQFSIVPYKIHNTPKNRYKEVFARKMKV